MSVYIEDIVHRAIFSSNDLIHSVQSQITKAQKLKLSLVKFPINSFKYKKEIEILEKSFIELFGEFQNKFVFNQNKIEDYKKGVVFSINENNDAYSLFFATLPAAMRGITKSDSKIENVEMVNLNLLSYSMSYNNLLERIESLFSTLRQEINLKEQMYNNLSFLWINFIIIFLALISIYSALSSSIR